MDMRFAYGITLLICMGVGFLVLLAFRKATGGKDEINPMTALIVGFVLLMALCFLTSVAQSWGSPDRFTITNEQIERAATGDQ